MISLLGIPLDVERLWTSEDPSFTVFVRALVQETHAMREEANGEA